MSDIRDWFNNLPMTVQMDYGIEQWVERYEHYETKELKDKVVSGEAKMTLGPSVLAEQMAKLHEDCGWDEEVFHSRADDMMVRELESLGYDMTVFTKADKWYA